MSSIRKQKKRVLLPPDAINISMQSQNLFRQIKNAPTQSAVNFFKQAVISCLNQHSTAQRTTSSSYRYF